jgi:hypothetical protein
MKSVLLLGSATLAAGVGITIEVELQPKVANVFGGCVANTVITTEEQCYAAATALRGTNQLRPEGSSSRADNGYNDNHPYPTILSTVTDFKQYPKGCSVYGAPSSWENGIGDEVFWNGGGDGGGDDAGTEFNDNAQYYASISHTICLVHDPEVQHKAVGDPCKEIERIHGAGQCQAAAGELGISGTVQVVQVVDAANRPQGCSSHAAGFYWNSGDGSSAPDDHQAICTSGKVWKSANELADASCEELSQEYRDDTCCTKCVA